MPTGSLVANSAEPLTMNSAESTQDLPHVHQTQSVKQNSSHTTPEKSFAEAVSNATANRNIHHQPPDLRKFFLADHIPQPIGVKSLIGGRPTLSFTDAETEELAAPYRFSLVGKFSHGAPPYSQMHQLIARLGIQGAFTVSMINSKHTLISLTSESDYSRLWLRRIWFLQGFPMRVFKWTPTFTPTQESSVVPIWVSFPELPAHLFRKDALFSIASMIGSPLQVDDLTLNKSKLSLARVCVEIDLLKPLNEELDLLVNGVTIVQKIVFEQLPEYCTLCKHVGHKASNCFSKGNASKPPSRSNFYSRQQKVAGIGKKQTRDIGKKVLEPIEQAERNKASSTIEKAECSKASQVCEASENTKHHSASQGKNVNPVHDKIAPASVSDCNAHTVVCNLRNEGIADHDVPLSPNPNVQNCNDAEEGEFIDNPKEDVHLSEDSEGEISQTETGLGGRKKNSANQLDVVSYIPYQNCIKIKDPACTLNINRIDTESGKKLLQELSPVSESSLLSSDQKMNALHRRSKSGGSKAQIFKLSKPARLSKKVTFLTKDKSDEPDSSSSLSS
ncbi:UNVERIFIED_CONTAM: hypothetical protein Sradi_7203400 [Sesamum radiatum]|uniref:DUF4283 domain-containing protein n=1 Tax=Sesamum radiatum TaxID=300843 RepID=A0AAW2ISC9_SESRA